LVGNKADNDMEESKRQVSRQEGEHYAKSNDLVYHEISAKDEAQLTHLFQQMKTLLV